MKLILPLALWWYDFEFITINLVEKNPFTFVSVEERSYMSVTLMHDDYVKLIIIFIYHMHYKKIGH
jgi:hypothetical protein